MAKCIIIKEADRCPFCGTEKIFLKKVRQGVYRKRIAVSLRCSSSKCGINGPQVFTDWAERGRGRELDAMVTPELISKAVERWNTRFMGKTI